MDCRRTLSLVVALIAMGWSKAAWAALPIGYVDKTSGNEIVGWARDPDIGGSIAVHIYVDDVIQVGVNANLDLEYIRPDAFAGGHGFYWRHDPFGPGTHHIDAYAIDVDSNGTLTGQNPPLVFNAAQTFGPFLFGYYWASAPQAPPAAGYGDFTDELAPFTNLMLVHTAPPAADTQAYIDRVNLSGSKLILDLTYCMLLPGGAINPDPDGRWETCKSEWFSKFRPQNIYGFYLADEPGGICDAGDPAWHNWISKLASLVKRDYAGKKTIISGHSGSWGPCLAGIDLDVFTVSLGCYWGGVQSCQENYAMLPASFSSGQLMTLGAFTSPTEYSNYSVAEQQPFVNWGRSNSRFNGILVFLYPDIGAGHGVRSNPALLAYHRAVGHEILCANTSEDDPVCGANGVTYPNADQAKCVGTTIARYGDCCNNECARGQTRCFGNEPQSCVADGACWIWPRQHGAGCAASCVEAGTRCNGEAIEHVQTCYGGSCQDGQCTNTASEEAWSTTMCNDAIEGTLDTTCVDGACVPIAPVATPDAGQDADVNQVADASPAVDVGSGTDVDPSADTSDPSSVVANAPQPTSTPPSAPPRSARDAGGLPATPQEMQLGDGLACNSGNDPRGSALLLALLLVMVARRQRRG